MSSVKNRGIPTTPIVSSINPATGTAKGLAENEFSKNDANRSDVNSAINFAYKTIDTMAQFARLKSDEFFNVLEHTTIDEFCNINYRMGLYRDKLMRMNDREIGITLASLGTDAMFKGNSNAYTSSRLSPSYAEKRNYVDNFALPISTSEDRGVLTTRENIDNKPKNYGNHNELYNESKNLYYDEHDTIPSDRININENQDSLLAKTKKLFNLKKVNTIISRFHTEDAPDYKGDKKSPYGLSHGRNLLTKKAEKSGGTGKYEINGYNNPYCRVWTHHHQYNQLDRLIRPFINEGGDGIVKFHDWSKLTDSDGNTEWHPNTRHDEYYYLPALAEDGPTPTPRAIRVVSRPDIGWKDNNPGWQHSVLTKGTDGLVNITPKYMGGGPNNIHTKDCMFSIENLAWKGYDPYSFETALSWEQRGPNGGRIMWFPPYGISFNETTSTRWNANTFIGRGEDVYTYINTTRQGTLNFMMVVDHPSVLDYVTHDATNQASVSDTDVLRFLAGCDSGDPTDTDSLLNKVKPTPLTDEYIQQNDEIQNVTKEPPVPPTPPEEEVSTEENIKVVFYVFYPNNYSGVYDDPRQLGSDSVVDPMAYLLAGDGAQKQAGSGNLTEDIPLKFDELGQASEDGYGYEMADGDGITKSNFIEKKNYIVGTDSWFFNRRRKPYNPIMTKKWGYRIDGKYEYPSENQYFISTYDQNVNFPAKDNYNYHFNCDVNRVKRNFPDENENELYSFAEVASAIVDGDIADAILNRCGKFIDTESERYTKLKGYFHQEDEDNGYKIVSIEAKGMSNSHDYNSMKYRDTNHIYGSTDSDGFIKVNQERNRNLAKQRALSVLNWFKSVNNGKYADVSALNNKFTFQRSIDVDPADRNNTSGESAKKYRSARVVLNIKKDAVVKTGQIPLWQRMKYIVDEHYYESENYYSDYSPVGFRYIETTTDNVKLYENASDDDYPERRGRKWYLYQTEEQIGTNNGEMRLYNFNPLTQRASMDWNSGKHKTKDDKNNYRYDQEYHFFKALEQKSPIVYDSLMKKLQYFDPAFHSMTPEGFNGRLTFLQQCMRQGNTVSDSDMNYGAANNLAFGMQPYCVLRLGDFYNQMIVINNISFNYDPLVWDLNEEGLGVQPLICNVSISFTFIGGGDISGCVRRLQNAMTFNYYANTSLADNRSDRVSIEWDDKICGAQSQGKIIGEESYWHNVQMY